MPTNSRLPVRGTQHRKLDYPFAAMPIERHPRWFEVSAYARFMGFELGAVARGNGSRPPRIAIGRDWREWLCRLLQLGGPDRRQAKRALDELYGAGLLVVGNGWVEIPLTPDEVANSGACQEPDGSLTEAYREPDGSLMQVTPQNDSTPTCTDQIRGDQIRERETRAHARETPKFEIPPWVDDAWEDPTPPAETPPAVSPTPPEPPDHRAQNDQNMWAQDPQPDNPMRIGHDFLAVLGLWNPGVRPDLVRYIGEQPEPERRAALEVLQRDKDWVRRNATVRHIVEHWRVYASGRTPIQRDNRPGLASTAPVAIEDIPIAKLEESLRQQRFLARKYPNEAIGRDAVKTIARIEAQLAARGGRAA